LEYQRLSKIVKIVLTEHDGITSQ